MSTKRWLFVTLIVCFFLLGAQTPPQDQPHITAPAAGSALQGTITIMGSTDIAGFQYAEVNFSYAGSQPESWFLIQQSQEPVKDSVLAVWDTTTIADGDYRLRLQVYLTNGELMSTELSGLRVRNYTPVETNTPTPAALSITPDIVFTPTPILLTATPRNTPTLFPLNPARVYPSSLNGSIAAGIGATVVLFIFLALYQAANRRGRS